jgi:hypothetical protein
MTCSWLPGNYCGGSPPSRDYVPSDGDCHWRQPATIAVTLVVNGEVIQTVAAGGYEDPIKNELPGLPWDVETRSPSGRVLSSMTVHAGDVWHTTDPNGGGEDKGDAVRVNLSCGRLDVWSGPPMLGPAFSPGPSGDCA